MSPPPAWSRRLRDARRAHGWDVTRLATELRRAAGSEATATTESLTRMIRDWERGHHSIRERYRLLLARLLDLPADAFTSHDHPPPPIPTTARGSGGQEEQIRAASAHIIALDELTGSSNTVHAAVRLAHRARHIALASGSSDLHSAAAEAQQIAGWTAFDAERHTLARQMTLESLLSARLAGDHTTELLSLSQLAMHDIHLHRPAEAHHLCKHALDQALTPRLRALFTLRLARALGQAGQPRRALELMRTVHGLTRIESIRRLRRHHGLLWAWRVPADVAYRLRAGVRIPEAASRVDEILSTPAPSRPSRLVRLKQRHAKTPHTSPAAPETTSETPAAPTTELDGLNEDVIRLYVESLKRGERLSCSQIAERTGVPRSTVGRHLKRYRDLAPVSQEA